MAASEAWPSLNLRRHRAAWLGILLVTTAGLGLYLIASTAIIAKDGVLYIRMAQQFHDDPVGVMQQRPCGYPFLIYVVHGMLRRFGEGSTNRLWIYSGQMVALAARVLSLIPIHLIGARFVGRRKSLQAVLVLIFLPNPAKVGADALRDWPHILFLTTGLAMLLAAPLAFAWRYALIGTIIGLGCWVRTEAAQLLLYGLVWLAWHTMVAKDGGRRKRLIASAGLLVIGFAVPVGLLLWARSGRLPYETEIILRSVSWRNASEGAVGPAVMPVMLAQWMVGAGEAASFAQALYQIFTGMGENLLWIYLPALLVGLIYRMRSKAGRQERFYIPFFIAMSLVSFLGRYYGIGPQVSSRYVLPLLAVLVFYVPVGLRVIGVYLDAWLRRRYQYRPAISGRRVRVPGLLLAVGVVLCLPKLFEPLRAEKKAYLQAVQWLKEHTPVQAKVATEDPRIPLYAERPVGNDDVGCDYLVRVMAHDDTRPPLAGWPPVFETSFGSGDRRTRIVIYQPR